VSLSALADIGAPAGRGQRTTLQLSSGTVLLIDESYNANPASMRAAFQAMSTVPRQTYPRRIAVLGDMLELGEQSVNFHRELHEPIKAAGIDEVFAVGPMMRHLFESLPQSLQGGWAQHASELVEPLRNAANAGCVVMVKGSLGTNMAPLVLAMKALPLAVHTR
jgi:UDP-N-acetylmuramoyl-tripeptide--D-alanyl-D-alanine ligase